MERKERGRVRGRVRYGERVGREENMDSERKMWIEEEMEGGLDGGCV